MFEKQYISNSEIDTVQIAITFSMKFLKGGDLVALYGELGTGKTKFVQGLCKGLGFSGTVSSPSFTIINEYSSSLFKIFHFDFYRVSSLAEIFDIGFEDYIYSKGICIIEWAEKAKDLLPPNRYDIFFQFGKSINERTIYIKKIESFIK